MKIEENKKIDKKVIRYNDKVKLKIMMGESI